MKHILFSLTIFLFAVLTLGSCLVAGSTYSRVAPGIWRGVLQLEKITFPVSDKDTIFVLHDQFKEGELPFNFEVIYTDDQNFYVEILNGTERIRCDSIDYGRDRSQARDTFNVHFPEYQSYLHIQVRGANMQGYWKVLSKKDYEIPFVAQAGKDYRFTNLKKEPLADLSGEWACTFSIETDDPYPAIAEFQQSGNKLSGTFRTETGDYRYLDGTVQGDEFWLSCFDGAHAFLFSGAIKGDTLSGEFRSGKHYRTLWSARRDSSFKLTSPDKLTSLRPNAEPVAFSFEQPDGQLLEFPGPYFEKPVSILTIMGSWCPNCKDEQTFLKQYLERNPEKAENMAVASLSFERNKDRETANRQLEVYQKQMKLPFPIVFAGEADKEFATTVFPALDKIISWPTMLVFDSNKKVRWIHTGFNGPATSKYKAFEAEFDQLISQLIAETQ